MMTTVVVARVYIVRHGETDANRAGIMQGQLDTPLNAAGAAQARLAADALADVPFSVACCSDLQRARKTAEIILGPHPDVRLETFEALRERFMGDWQGGSIAKRRDPPANLEPVAEFMARAVTWWNETIVRHAQRKAAELARLRSYPPQRQNGNGNAREPSGGQREDGDGASPDMNVDPDGGEDEDNASPDPELDFEPVHVLAVSHGGLIGSLFTHLVESRKVQVGTGVALGRCFNGSISVVELGADGRGVLVSYADTTHLAGDADIVLENADVLR